MEKIFQSALHKERDGNKKSTVQLIINMMHRTHTESAHELCEMLQRKNAHSFPQLYHIMHPLTERGEGNRRRWQQNGKFTYRVEYFFIVLCDRHKGGALTIEIPAKNVWQHTPSGTTPRQKSGAVCAHPAHLRTTLHMQRRVMIEIFFNQTDSIFENGKNTHFSCPPVNQVK
jgi:hypothetical protein